MATLFPGLILHITCPHKSGRSTVISQTNVRLSHVLEWLSCSFFCPCVFIPRGCRLICCLICNLTNCFTASFYVMQKLQSVFLHYLFCCQLSQSSTMVTNTDGGYSQLAMTSSSVCLLPCRPILSGRVKVLPLALSSTPLCHQPWQLAVCRLNS